MNTILALSAGAVALATLAVLLGLQSLHQRAQQARVLRMIGAEPGSAAAGSITGDWLAGIGMRYRRFYSADDLEQLRGMIQASGWNPYRVMPMLIGGKTVAMLGAPALTGLAAVALGKPLTGILLWVAIGGVVGVMGPQLLMSLIQRRFRTAVQKGTPDAIDLLVVCSEAGMGLEGAIERVAQEMERSNPAMARVLGTLLSDLRVMPDRREALEKFSKRSTTDGLRRLGTMIGQSLQYGTPLSHALRALADELRRDRMIKLEERAHKLGAKLIIPMVLFLLPAMFVILGGSSFLHLISAFKNLH